MTETREYPLSLREDPARPGTLSGVAVPWGEPYALGHAREVFRRGAVDPAAVTGMPLMWRHDTPIGVITAARDTAAGLEIEARVSDTALGRDSLTLMRDGATTGLSIGFEPLQDEWSRDRSTVTRTRARVFEVSVTPTPAYPSARLTAVREEPNVTTETTETTAPPAEVATREDLATLATREDLAALEARIHAAPPAPAALPYASAGAMLRDLALALPGWEERREAFTRAAGDVNLAGSGNNPVGWSRDWLRAVRHGRPFAEAVGIRPLPDAGTSVSYPKVTAGTVAAQASEQAAAAQNTFATTEGTAPVVTYFGAAPLSIQVIERSDPAVLDEFLYDMAQGYAGAVDLALITACNAATQAVAFDALTTEGIGAALGEAAGLIAAGAGSLDTVALAPDLFYRVVLGAGNGYPLAGGTIGGGSLASGTAVISGVTFVADANLAANTGLAVNGESVRVWEAAGSPANVTANVPNTLTQSVAVYGYAAVAMRRATGVVKLTGPAPAAARSGR